jgi:hypothetical protein
MPGPHDFAVRSDLRQAFDRPCAACRNPGEGSEAPFVRAPVDRSRGVPPCDHLLRAGAAASTASHRAFRDDREPPLFRVRRRELVEMICPTGEANYFLRQGWTGDSLICPSGKLRRGLMRRHGRKSSLHRLKDGKGYTADPVQSRYRKSFWPVRIPDQGVNP